ncbi:MAG: hypothetical protein MI863_12880 [Desulfobacterales bacterium]|nr:hypothetical protein [Desulfobacterales bacterium]
MDGKNNNRRPVKSGRDIMKREMRFSCGVGLTVGILSLWEIEPAGLLGWAKWLGAVSVFCLITGLMGSLKRYLLTRI